MPGSREAVEFLIDHDSLRLGESPWTTYTEDDDIHPIDWPRLFPGGSPSQDGENPWDIFGDEWDPDWDDDFISEVQGVLADHDRLLDHDRDGPATAGEQPDGRGWDRCAWYQPIHFFGYDWGIFIREECVRHTALGIASFLRTSHLGGSRNVRLLAKALWRAGLYVYFLHEHFHHKVESLGFRLHVVEQRSLYLPYKTGVYDACLGTDDQLEEALANADSFLRLSHDPYVRWITKPVVDATRDYLRNRFPFDPPGYRRAVDYLRKDLFDSGENLLQARVREATLTPKHRPGDWDLAPRMTQSFLNVRSSIWVVVPRGATPKIPTAALPAPTCSTREIVDLCTRAGYQVIPGGKGSHVKLARANAPTIVVPGNRKTLSTGVVRTTLRVLGQFKLRDLPSLLSGNTQLGQTGN